MPEDLESAFVNMHQLSRNERTATAKELLTKKPEFLRPFTPIWWWFKPCEVNVLLVTDGGLDFEFSGFGLSEFITSFNKLQQQSLLNVRYKVTLAYRGALMPVNNNSVVVNRINNFDFVTSVNLKDFDQVWLFGFDSISLPSNGVITRPNPVPPSRTYLFQDEIDAITNYMKGGGGLFATGDHGSLGSALCSQIPRVKDMRYWSDFGANEVGMNEERRNDTNRPGMGQSVSVLFNNQSDNIPQNIAVRTFGAGQAHPLLSISTAKRASGIIDIMPDHPHEGECKPEITFSVTNPATNTLQQVSTQVIATSFVLGGSTAAGKYPTQPHCFPSISVFDGRAANIGRIVIDSTWHHFVNINLNGIGGGIGLTDNDFDVVQQYYMNIANWMTRRKSMLCWKRWIWLYLLKDTQLIESALNNPKQETGDIEPHDLYAIGTLAKEIIAFEFTPVFAEEFMIDLLEEVAPNYAEHLYVWSPDKTKVGNDLINNTYIVGVAIGAGFISLRDALGEDLDNNTITEKDFNDMYKHFDKGLQYGLSLAIANFHKDVEYLNSIFSKTEQSKGKKGAKR